MKFVPLEPGAPPLEVGYIVRGKHRSDLLEKFIDALHSISRGHCIGNARWH